MPQWLGMCKAAGRWGAHTGSTANPAALLCTPASLCAPPPPKTTPLCVLSPQHPKPQRSNGAGWRCPALLQFTNVSKEQYALSDQVINLARTVGRMLYP